MQYKSLVDVYEKLGSTSKRLEKTQIISELLKDTKQDDIHYVVLLLKGRVFPDWDETKIGVASKLIAKAISTATGYAPDKVEKEWKKTGDLGETAENLISKKTQATLFSQNLTIKKVFDNIRKLATLEGSGSVDQKIKLVAELLTSAKPVEAKYIVRTVLEELRVGVAHGTLRDAVVWAYFGKDLKIKYDKEKNDISLDAEQRKSYNEHVDAVQSALDASNDFSLVAEAASKGLKELAKISLKVGTPIKVMLAPKAKNVADAFERVGKPAEAEFKMDGFRMQVHKDKDKITIFTRRLDNVTKQFPDVVEAVRKHTKADSFILDSEAVGYNPDTKKYLPFQNISQRIKRKYDIEDMAKKLPVELNVFDVLEYNGKPTLSTPFRERREIIERIIKESPRHIVLAEKLVTDKEDAVAKFFKKSIAAGHEGLMLKNLDAPYKPGARVGYMVKLKETMENLDLAIVGAEWGEGKRSSWLSSFTLACIDDEGNYLKIGKVGTGIKEKEEFKGEEGITFEELTKLLKPLITKEKGREVSVKPKVIVEVAYEEIQKSPTYSSGYALRFPRLMRLRSDERDEPSDLDLVEDLYHGQNK